MERQAARRVEFKELSSCCCPQRSEANQPASQQQHLYKHSQSSLNMLGHGESLLLGKLATSQGVKALCATDSVQSHACCCCCCGCFNQLLFNKNGSTHDLVPPPPPPSLCLSCSSASQVAADQVNVKGLKLGSNLSSKANSNTISGCRYLSRNVLHFFSWEAIVVTSMTNKAGGKKKLQMQI